jgi:hypothetical protein
LFNCSSWRDLNFKILGLFKPQSNKTGGAHMTIETITILGVIFAAATLARMAYERRMDVLYGPYLESRAGSRPGLSFAADRLWKPIQSAVDRFSWKARNVVYLAAVIAC